jgi:hypothetical protein
VIIRINFINIISKFDNSIIAKIEIPGISAIFRTSISYPVNYRKRIEINRDKQTII